jgi:6-phosphogluconolactonase
MISPQAPDIKISSSKEELAQEVADLVNLRVRLKLNEKGFFHLALTGGSLGILISEILVRQWNDEPEKFAGLHLWWGDERFVPELSAERNARPVLMELSDESAIHVHQVMPSDSNVDVEVAAKRYSADLFGIDMDLALLGLGPDGHVASLFPKKWELREERNAIAVLDSPKPPPQRVSLSMSKINSSRSVWFVVSGSEKHDAIEKIIARDSSIPAVHVHGRVETLLFADLAALASD